MGKLCRKRRAWCLEGPGVKLEEGVREGGKGELARPTGAASPTASCSAMTFGPLCDIGETPKRRDQQGALGGMILAIQDSRICVPVGEEGYHKVGAEVRKKSERIRKVKRSGDHLRTS